MKSDPCLLPGGIDITRIKQQAAQTETARCVAMVRQLADQYEAEGERFGWRGANCLVAAGMLRDLALDMLDKKHGAP